MLKISLTKDKKESPTKQVNEAINQETKLPASHVIKRDSSNQIYHTYTKSKVPNSDTINSNDRFNIVHKESHPPLTNDNPPPPIRERAARYVEVANAHLLFSPQIQPPVKITQHTQNKQQRDRSAQNEMEKSKFG